MKRYAILRGIMLWPDGARSHWLISSSLWILIFPNRTRGKRVVDDKCAARPSGEAARPQPFQGEPRGESPPARCPKPTRRNAGASSTPVATNHPRAVTTAGHAQIHSAGHAGAYHAQTHRRQESSAALAVARCGLLRRACQGYEAATDRFPKSRPGRCPSHQGW